MNVLLYGDWPLATTYLNPLAQYIEEHEPDWEVSFAGDLGMSYPVTDTTFDVVISCDELSAAPRGRLNVCIFHGLASKGQAFSNARRYAFVNTDTVFAVAGPYYRRLLLNMGVPQERVFVAGLTKFDGMRRNILYAPTHNAQLSAIPVIQNRIYEFPNVKVHLHQWTRTHENEHHQVLKSFYPIHEDREDVSDLIRRADVIIGDFGSIIVEAIALGKQAIQVVNPLFKDWYLDVVGISEEEMLALPEVYLPSKYATRVHSFDELRDALGVVANIGSASQRIVERIKRAF